MLDAALAGRRGLCCAHRDRHMPDDRNAAALRRVEQREVALARNQVVHLDEIRPACGERIHDPDGCLGGADRDGSALRRARPVHDGAVGDEPRSDDRAGSEFPLDRGDELQRGVHARVHVANAGHAEGEERRQLPAGRRRRVRMHVPETGDQESAGAAHDLRPGRERCACIHDLRNAAAANDDGPAGGDLAGLDVDDRDIADRKRRASGVAGRRGARTAGNQDRSHRASDQISSHRRNSVGTPGRLPGVSYVHFEVMGYTAAGREVLRHCVKRCGNAWCLTDKQNGEAP